MQNISHVNEQSQFDRIWALFQETREQIKETGAQLKETDRMLSQMSRETDAKIKETDRMLSAKFKETDRMLSAKFKETDEKFKETDEKFKETDEKFKETDEKFKETDTKFKETDTKFKETQKMVGNLTNSWGAFVEGMVIPSVVKIFNERNIDIEEVYSRAKSRKKNETMEIDIIGDNTSYVVAIEVKSKLLSYDILHFVEKLGRFKYFFPKYANKKLIGAVAGIIIDDSVKNLALDKELFIIAQKGENVEIINDKDFNPKFW
jgi:hypothetical protein